MRIDHDLSSRHPDDLYKNGIQRESFIPAIELLKHRFVVTDLNSGTGELLDGVADVRVFLTQTCQIIERCPVRYPKCTTAQSRQKIVSSSTNFSMP